MCGQGVENVKTGFGKRHNLEIERQIVDYMIDVRNCVQKDSGQSRQLWGGGIGISV